MINPACKPVLSRQDVQMIREQAFQALSEIGVGCEHERTRDILCQTSRTRYEKGRLFFNKDELEEFFKQVAGEIQEKGRSQPPEDFSMGGSWNCLQLCDPATNRPRPAEVEEVEQCARLSTALGAKGGPVPVAPSGIEPKLKTVTCEMIALTQTPALGGWLTANKTEEIKIISEMHQAAGRIYTLGLEGLISPLRMNPAVMDTYFEWCDSPHLQIGIMGGIPVAGTTAPLVFPANAALALAEAIALDFMMDRISSGRHRCWNLRLELGNMRNANLCYGTPEHCLMIQAMYELNWELFGVKPRNGAFRTNGKIVDSQTVMERTGVVLFQAMWGARRFSSVGQLSVDEVYSPVQAVLDLEILRYAKRLYSGANAGMFAPAEDTLEILRQGVEEQGFLAHPTTFENFRDFFGLDRMAQASFLSEWKGTGSKPLEALAWEQGQKLLAEYEFSLPPERHKEVMKLYQTAKRVL